MRFIYQWEWYIFMPKYCVHRRIAAKTLHINTSAMKQNELQQGLYILMIQVQWSKTLKCDNYQDLMVHHYQFWSFAWCTSLFEFSDQLQPPLFGLSSSHEYFYSCSDSSCSRWRARNHRYICLLPSKAPASFKPFQKQLRAINRRQSPINFDK